MAVKSLVDYLTEVLGANAKARVSDIAARAAGSPELAAQLNTAAQIMEDTGNRTPLLKLIADDQWKRAPAGRDAPQTSGRLGSRDPVSFEQRLSTDPNVARVIGDAGESLPLEVRQRAQAGDPDAVADAYQAGEAAEKRANRRARRKSARQMEPPLGDSPTGMIPFGVRGAGVPVGGPSGPGSRVGESAGGQMIPASSPNALTPDNLLARLRGPDSLYRPSSTEVGRPRLPRLPDKRLSTDVDLEGIAGPGPRMRVWQEGPRRLPGQVADDAPVIRSPARVIDEAEPPIVPSRRSLGPLAAAALAGAAGVAGKYIYDQFQNDNLSNTESEFTPMPSDDAIDSTDGAADLAAETTPPPEVVMPDAPVDYSVEARKIIDDLNARRRAAGGEVPEAPAMMAEANRLMELGNRTRRATYAAAPQDDASRYYQQAQGLIDQVNQMYRQGMTPNSPAVRQVMAEVRRLQQMGDSIRNRRAG